MSLVTRPLIGIVGESISELNNEFVYVSNVMKFAALNYLPLVKNKKKTKPRFVSPELRDLCDATKSAWKRWNAGGYQYQTLYMRITKMQTKEYVVAFRTVMLFLNVSIFSEEIGCLEMVIDLVLNYLVNRNQPVKSFS